MEATRPSSLPTVRWFSNKPTAPRFLASARGGAARNLIAIMKYFLLLPLLVLALLSGTASAAGEAVSRIAFGSCSNEKKAQPVWEAINALKPQLFIFSGDNVYADSADPAVLKASYDKLSALPGFAALRSSCPVIGTWDDHDYGANDAGAEWEGKAAAKEAFVDFFELPADSPVRRRGGIYDARIFGPEGRRVQVILLDTRWFRGPLKRMPKDEEKSMRAAGDGWKGPYLPDEDSDATILGEDQWNWLEEQLKQPADLRLLVTSIQAVPFEHGWEKWGNLPKERGRLFRLLRESGASGIVILSGDRHTADISKLPASTDGSPGYPLYEATSSGLNQNGFSKENNRYRLGNEPPFGKSNFGWLTIDWSKPDPPITLEIRDVGGKIVRETSFTLGQISGK